MFKEILGILVDSEGNYLSFGKSNIVNENKKNYYLFLHGRACMSQIYFHHWHQTHPDLGLEHFNFKDIFTFSYEKDIDDEIYSYFQRWSNLGYIVLYNKSYYYDLPFIQGHVPYHLTKSQALFLLSLQDSFSEDTKRFSEIFMPNEAVISLENVFEEAKDIVFSKEQNLR